MQLNPILKRELTVKSRSYGMPLMVSLANGILLFAGLLGAFGILTRMQLSGQPDYGAFLKIYAVLGLLTFFLMMLITPSLTSGSICIERQTQTLDLLLTTQMSQKDVILGTFSAALWELVVLLCSAAPSLLIPLMYGGVTLPETFLLLLVLAFEAGFLLLVGLFASTRCHTAMRSTATAYGIVAFLVIGTLLVSALARPFCADGENYTAYLLTLNPLVTVAALLARQIGEWQFLELLFQELRLSPDPVFLHYFVPLSLIFQAAAAFSLFVGAVLGIMPERDKNRTKQARKLRLSRMPKQGAAKLLLGKKIEKKQGQLQETNEKTKQNTAEAEKTGQKKEETGKKSGRKKR